MDEDKPVCDCCHYRAELKSYRGPLRGQNIVGELDGSKFCLICASTFLSHCVTYPMLYSMDASLFSSIGWIANYLADLIRSQKESFHGDAV